MYISGRIANDVVSIDEESVKKFYSGRSKLANDNNPHNVVNLQDADPSLTQARDKHEKETVIPFLEMNGECIVLDIGCGTGRWAETVLPSCKRYFGVDFVPELVDICRRRFLQYGEKSEFIAQSFQKSALELKKTERNAFNRVIIAGVCLYTNDEDLFGSFENLADIVSDDAIIYIREPIAVDERLTLKEVYSEELKSDYSAIYRTVDQYHDLFAKLCYKKGFKCIHQEDLTTGALRNRAETTQYIFILKKP